MITHAYTYAYAAVDVHSGALDTLVLPHVTTACMQVFLEEVAQRHRDEHILRVLDGAGWHRSLPLEVPPNMALLPLPPYVPELNPVEHLWDEIREKHFHNRVFDSLENLEDQLVAALCVTVQAPDRVRSIVAWSWIVDALLK